MFILWADTFSWSEECYLTVNKTCFPVVSQVLFLSRHPKLVILLNVVNQLDPSQGHMYLDGGLRVDVISEMRIIEASLENNSQGLLHSNSSSLSPLTLLDDLW